jgi:phage baseplate assembly protein W
MGDVIRAVREALDAWEPRIDVTSVDAVPHPDDPSGLLVALEYTVRATNSRQNLVYPFYLKAP